MSALCFHGCRGVSPVCAGLSFGSASCINKNGCRDDTTPSLAGAGCACDIGETAPPRCTAAVDSLTGRATVGAIRARCRSCSSTLLADSGHKRMRPPRPANGLFPQQQDVCQITWQLFVIRHGYALQYVSVLHYVTSSK